MLGEIRQLHQQGRAVLLAFAHAQDAAAADAESRLAHPLQGIQPILVGAGRDDLGVVGFRGIQIMVVVIEPGRLQTLRLTIGQHAQRYAGFEPQGFDALDHLADALDVAIIRAAPGGSHAETTGALRLGCPRRLQHLLDRHQGFLAQPGVIMRALRTVGAVLGTGTGLDAQQAGNLHLVGIEMLAMHGLSLKQQIIERLLQQRHRLRHGPVVSQGTVRMRCHETGG